MTTKRKSSAKKSVIKKTETKVKAAVKKLAPQAKKAKKKTPAPSTVRKRAATRRVKSESQASESVTSLPVFGLIDQAAGFLHKALAEADRATANERRALREHAFSFVDGASKRLMQVLEDEPEKTTKRSR